MSIRIDKKLLAGAVAEEVLTQTQASALQKKLKEQVESQRNPVYFLSGFGGLLILLAVIPFVGHYFDFDLRQGSGVLVTALVYAIMGTSCAEYYWRKGLHGATKILLLLVAGLIVPLGVYGLQGVLLSALGASEVLWENVWAWTPAHASTATILACLFFIRRYRYPVLLFIPPIALLTIATNVIVEAGSDTLSGTFYVAMIFFFLTYGLTLWLEYHRKLKPDWGFWLYASSSFMLYIAFPGACSVYVSSFLPTLLYPVACLMLAGLGLVFAEKIFVAFGLIGVYLYLGYALGEFFVGSFVFPLVLIALGLLAIFLAVYWRKHQEAIHVKVMGILPAPIHKFLEYRAVDL